MQKDEVKPVCLEEVCWKIEDILVYSAKDNVACTRKQVNFHGEQR